MGAGNYEGAGFPDDKNVSVFTEGQALGLTGKRPRHKVGAVQFAAVGVQPEEAG